MHIDTVSGTGTDMLCNPVDTNQGLRGIVPVLTGEWRLGVNRSWAVGAGSSL
jgi:hypothetical protein